MTCKKHPRYKGKGRPTSKCPRCLDIYCLAHPLTFPPAVPLYVVRIYSGNKLVYVQTVEKARVSVEKL